MPSMFITQVYLMLCVVNDNVFASCNIPVDAFSPIRLRFQVKLIAMAKEPHHITGKNQRTELTHALSS